MKVFFTDKKKRNRRCREKDKVTEVILNKIKVINPFHVLLMPNLYGKELFWLRKNNVDFKNVYAVEREKNIWSKYINPGNLKHLNNIQTTSKPMSAEISIDYIYPKQNKFNMIYLDFYARSNTKHFEVVKKIIGMNMIKEGGVFIITHGKTRSSSLQTYIERELNDEMDKITVDIEIDRWKSKRYKKYEQFRYRSTEGNSRPEYIVSVFWF